MPPSRFHLLDGRHHHYWWAFYVATSTLFIRRNLLACPAKNAPYFLYHFFCSFTVRTHRYSKTWFAFLFDTVWWYEYGEFCLSVHRIHGHLNRSYGRHKNTTITALLLWGWQRPHLSACYVFIPLLHLTRACSSLNTVIADLIRGHFSKQIPIINKIGLTKYKNLIWRFIREKDITYLIKRLGYFLTKLSPEDLWRR